MVHLSSLATLLLPIIPAQSFGQEAFVATSSPVHRRSDVRLAHGCRLALMATPPRNEESLGGDSNVAVVGRRSFVSSSGGFLAFLAAVQASIPDAASAGIDVSGLRTEGGGGDSSTIASQLKGYDGSASARVREIKAAQDEKAGSTAQPPAAARPAVADTGSAATYALRSGGLPSLRSVGLGLLNRYEGYVAPPPGSKLRQIPISFDFPADWLQLDKLGGGIQYVDQRNGDKLYILRAPLPEGTTLATAPKSFFAEAIFDPRGDIVRSGTVVEGGRVSKSTLLNECPDGSCATRRRLLLKYDTVTGSGVQTVERRGLVDAYEVDGEAYMLMTSSNAVKFEAKGKERETVENIANSFRLSI